ncbi:hypothetical protein CSOJ01_08475 [Colletotrichum sojae]|uniref:2EXR domain-containing protein n=1 Tax=Colletotrichum sojae TaxID=2175907 RepID=A0A8H6MSY0_9PEZI|nr:hypothetical protein CSOJ01_08475 [Colletotrichum sojae]
MTISTEGFVSEDAFHIPRRYVEPIRVNFSCTDFYQLLIPQLPLELRLVVWRLSLPEPRTVSIPYGATTLSQNGDFRNRTSKAEVATILHFSHESRQEGLRYCKLRFGVAGPAKVFFDSEVDILHVGRMEGFMTSCSQYLTFMVVCNQSDLEETRHLAIDESVLGDGIKDRAVLCSAESILR